MKSAAALLTIALAAPAAHAGWWDDLAEPRAAAPEDVARDTSRWSDLPVTLAERCDVSAVPPAGFDGADWRAFLLGTGPAAIPVVVRAGSPEEELVARLHPGETVRVTGTVRAAPSGPAVVEAAEIVRAGDPLTASERDQHERAATLLAKDNAPAAERLWRRLLASRDFSRADRALLWDGVAQACRAQRKLEEATVAYRNVLSLDAVREDTAADLERLTEAIRRDRERAESGQFARAGAPVPPMRLAPPAFGTPGTAAPAQPTTQPPAPGAPSAPTRATPGAPAPAPAPVAPPTAAPAAAPVLPEAPPPTLAAPR